MAALAGEANVVPPTQPINHQSNKSATGILYDCSSVYSPVGRNVFCSKVTRRTRPPRQLPSSASRAAPISNSSRFTKPKPRHRPVMTSVARLTDRTTPYSENKLFKPSTVMCEERLCTFIFVMVLLQRCRDCVASFLDFFSAFRSFGVIVGFFLASFFGLRSLDILFAPDPSTSNPLYRGMTNGRFALVADIRFRLDRQSRQ